MVEVECYTLDETATAVAEGLVLGTVGATGQYCGEARGTFGIGALNLASLASDGVVQVEVQNSHYVDVYGCSTNTHDVRLHYVAAASPVDFGSLFVGQSRSLLLRIENRGTETLEISSIASDLAEFVPSVSALSIPPHQSAEVTITFTAASAGVYDGVLTILSNDADEPSVTVALHGEGLIPPGIDVTPTSLSADLLSNQTVTQTLTIVNTGGSDLDYRISPQGVAGERLPSRCRLLSCRARPSDRRSLPIVR